VITIPKPTKEDASLFLQILAIMNADEDYQEAMRWFTEEVNETNYDDFKTKYPMGSEGYRNFMTLGSYAELIGTLINKEILSEDLIFDLYGSLFWEKAGPFVHGIRNDLKMPRLFENYEVCAKKYPEWAEKNPPKV
jgi:hypothetical protein